MLYLWWSFVICVKTRMISSIFVLKYFSAFNYLKTPVCCFRRWENIKDKLGVGCFIFSLGNIFILPWCEIQDLRDDEFLKAPFFTVLPSVSSRSNKSLSWKTSTTCWMRARCPTSSQWMRSRRSATKCANWTVSVTRVNRQTAHL